MSEPVPQGRGRGSGRGLVRPGGQGTLFPCGQRRGHPHSIPGAWMGARHKESFPSSPLGQATQFHAGVDQQAHCSSAPDFQNQHFVGFFFFFFPAPEACRGSQARDQTHTHHSRDWSHSSDNTGFLTHGATRKLPKSFWSLLFLLPAFSFFLF